MAAADTPSPFNPRFLVVSLGNPAPWTKTLHSAGHLALQAVQQRLHLACGQPPFSSQKIGKKGTKASAGDKYTLVQCPTYMNESGPWVAKAWKQILAAHIVQEPSRPLGLVIVNDDLKEDLGVIKAQKWERSHRGHNGMKSIKSVMNAEDYKRSKWGRVAVGIGQPAVMDGETQTAFVLRPWSKHEEDVLWENSGPGVLAALDEIEEAWRAEREWRRQAAATSNDQPGKTKKQRLSNRQTPAGGAIDDLA
jgi:peptidyl-tRNA hydrolase, PTH1 family